MSEIKESLRKLIAAIDEAPAPDDRCVVCNTETADHEDGCAYQAAVAQLALADKADSALLGRCRRAVEAVLARGGLEDDDAFVEAVRPLSEFVKSSIFRRIHRQAIQAPWWKEFTRKFGARLESQEILAKLHDGRL